MSILPLSLLCMLGSDSLSQLHPELKWQFYFHPQWSRSEDYPATGSALPAPAPTRLSAATGNVGTAGGRDFRQM